VPTPEPAVAPPPAAPLSLPWPEAADPPSGWSSGVGLGAALEVADSEPPGRVQGRVQVVAVRNATAFLFTYMHAGVLLQHPCCATGKLHPCCIRLFSESNQQLPAALILATPPSHSPVVLGSGGAFSLIFSRLSSKMA
jgi:hypothetical protein